MDYLLNNKNEEIRDAAETFDSHYFMLSVYLYDSFDLANQICENYNLDHLINGNLLYRVCDAIDEIGQIEQDIFTAANKHNSPLFSCIIQSIHYVMYRLIGSVNCTSIHLEFNVDKVLKKNVFEDIILAIDLHRFRNHDIDRNLLKRFSRQYDLTNQRILSQAQSVCIAILELLENKVDYFYNEYIQYLPAFNESFEDAAREYCLNVLDYEKTDLGNQARRLLKPWKPNLTIEHWTEMKITEEKALDLAIKGELVACQDEDMSYYSEKEREMLENHKSVLKIIRDNFDDDTLFPFDSINIKDIDNSDIMKISGILVVLIRYIIRGNIIRCNLFPELKPKFDEWLHGKDASVSQEEQETIARRNAKEQRVWKNLQDEGLVDQDLQPICLELEEKAVLARAIATTLEIKHEWVYFGNLWHMDKESLRKAYSRKFEKKDGGDLLVKYQKITNI